MQQNIQQSIQHKSVTTATLDIAYLEFGSADGWPCVLSHGFPYDVLCYVEAAEKIAAAGARVIVPWLRGYGPTRFLSSDTPRSGEQAVLAADLLALMDALQIERAVLAGYDWGGRAGCIVAALFPERVTALVTVNGYNLQDIARCNEPASASLEAGFWYQYYFHNERGRRGLQSNRDDICKTLWQMWSPDWAFDDDTFNASAQSFHNPDFVDVVIHSYRHRFALVPGDPACAHLETQLTAQPDITVPTIIIDGASDGVHPPSESANQKFTQLLDYRVLQGIGHNPAQEDPAAWADAVVTAYRQ
jgi:pimeloyl-ACP methyl ester carboxylesterase